MKTKSSYTKHWEIRQFVIAAVLGGLDGRPFNWGYSSGATDAWMRIAKEFGITLIAESALKKHGLQLVRGAKPVGRVAYGAPISNTGDVYVKECQTRPIDQGED